MGKKPKLKVISSIDSRKLEAIMRQIARIQSGESKSLIPIKELRKMQDELLAKLNG